MRDFQQDAVVVRLPGKGGLVDDIAPDKEQGARMEWVDFGTDEVTAFSLQQIVNLIVVIVDMHIGHGVIKVPDDAADGQTFH